MEVLVCVKRVPAPGAKIVLTPDGQDIDTRHLGFTARRSVTVCPRRNATMA
jgi:electron transfer flavoprotein alpha/beta subunit